MKKLENITDPLIKQRYLKYFQLPQDLRQTIFAVETANKIGEVADKNNLNEKQLWWASHTTGMILLGETNIVDFVKTLKTKCQLTDAPVRQLARDINQIIFLPVKESLKTIHQVPEWPRESEMPAQEKSLAKQNTLQKPIPPMKATLPETNEPRLEGNVVNLKNH